MLTEVAAFVVVSLVFWWSWSRSQRSDFVRKINLLPGPPTIPVFGNALSIVFRNPEELFIWIWKQRPLGLTGRAWIFNQAHIGIGRSKDAEPILRSSKFITKSDNYKFLRPWLGDGLITADGDHWRKLRKIITPAFHFEILHEFLPIFVDHSLTMVKLLAEEPAATSEQGFNISPYSSRCSFDIICESAMGTKINAQLDKNAPYVKAVNCVLDLIFYRYTTPWLHPEITWKFSSAKKQMEQHIRYIDEFGDKVIAERREYLKTVERRNGEEIIFGKKRSMAFLDKLLTSEETDNLSQEDIRSNVNVFMFAGYDTVATSMSWVLFLLGSYPEIQAKVVEELVEVFGDSGRVPDVADLLNLKYLELCIKESLRLYPSVLFTERAIKEDVQLEKFLLPGGCTAMFYYYSLHRDPEFFPEPEKFDPDRFLPENSQGRYPYAYMPFSAGPRNCIGQKYALLEQKAVLSTVLRRFRVEAAQTREQLRLQVNIVLRPVDGVKIRVFDRVSHPRLRVSSKHV